MTPIQNRLSRKHLLRVFGIITAQKAALMVLLLVYPTLFPALFSASGGGREFQTWDTGGYLEIARGGYGSGELCALYPLWPACIKAAALLIGGRALAASYVLANLLSLGGLLMFHRLVWEKVGLASAYGATLILLFFPGAMFFLVPYSESLFFFLLMVCLLCLQRKAYGGAAAAAALLPLTRATGIFVLPLMAREVFRNRAPLRTYAICVAPLAGYAAYFGIMWRCTGSGMAGFDAQRMFPSQPCVANLLDLPGFVHCFLGFGWRHDFLHSFIDRLVFVAYLLTLFWVIRLDLGYYAYALLAGMVPALSVSLMSFTRYCALVFPVFIVWGSLPKKGWCIAFILLLFFGLQVMFLLLHVSGRWAG